MLTFLNRIPSYVRIPFFTVLFLLPVAIEFGMAQLIMHPPSLSADLHHDAGNIKRSMIGYDLHNHLTLNGVPLGVPVDMAMSACPGDPQEARVLCHGPFSKTSGDYLKADVYGFDTGKDRDGKPVVTSMTIYTAALNDMTIADVNAHIATTSSLPTIVNTTEAIGTPSMRSYGNMKDMSWERDGHSVAMSQWLSTEDADLDLSEH